MKLRYSSHASKTSGVMTLAAHTAPADPSAYERRDRSEGRASERGEGTYIVIMRSFLISCAGYRRDPVVLTEAVAAPVRRRLCRHRSGLTFSA